ncbi:MAG: hypothetical protein ACUVTR_05430 [Dehalococcoidia bacterium]
MPSKEVGHDTERSLVMPLGISRRELPGSVEMGSEDSCGALLESSWKP